MRSRISRISPWGLSDIVLLTIIISPVLVFTNRFLFQFDLFCKDGKVVKDFYDFIIGLNIPWLLSMLSVFLKGRDQHRVAYKKYMIRTAFICTYLSIIAQIVGVGHFGTNNTVALIAFIALFIIKLYGYVSASIVWLCY